MSSFVLIVRDILRLRSGPQDLPFSPALLARVGGACVLMQIVVALSMDDLSLAAAIGGALLWLIFTLLVLRLLLTVRGLRHRFVQMATALLACTLVFTTLSLPIAILAGDAPTVAQDMTPLQLLLGTISLPILIWKLVVDAHIFRHSLNLPFAGGMLIALLWIGVALGLRNLAGAA